MSILTISEARENLADLVNRAAYAGQRTTISRHGKATAAIVSAADLALLEAIENEVDLDAVRRALADPTNATPVALTDVIGRLRR